MEGRSHRPVFEPGLCEPCGVCRGACPAASFPDLLPEEGSLRGVLKPAPFSEKALPPCREACLLGQDISGYLECLAQGDRDGAFEIIAKDNPLPSVLGHVFHRPCEAACARCKLNRAPRIRDLKAFAAGGKPPPPRRGSRAKGLRTAVVGSGPAGLGAAWRLAQQGATVRLFEAEKVAGGLLAWAIPPFRLPREALGRDLERILALGVELELGRKVTPEEVRALQEEGWGIVLACGAPLPAEMALPGQHLPGVFQGLDFLRRAALGPEPELEDPVLVVGGGNAAMDAARWVLRRGKRALLSYRRGPQEMPAYEEEVDLARREGLEFLFWTCPVNLEPGEDGRIRAVRLARTSPAGQDKDGRAGFQVQPEEVTRVEAGSLILAVGQRREERLWKEGLGLSSLSPGPSGQLASGIYGAGDLVTGPATVLEAVAGGIRCAEAMMKEKGL